MPAAYLSGVMKHDQTPELSVSFLLHDVARLLRKRFEQRARAAKLGLTRAQWQVLANLARREGINQAALAQHLEIEPITLVRILDRLETAGLVERRQDPQDRRARILFLTEAAHPLMERIWKLAAEVRGEAMAGLSEADRDRLMTLLSTMKGNILDRLGCATIDEQVGDADEPVAERKMGRVHG